MSMTKAAIVLLAGADSHADLGRATNALETVKQFQDAGDEARLVFDGAGVVWVPRVTDPDDDLHGLFSEVEGRVHGACQFCANAFGVRDELEASDIPLLDEKDRHPDIHRFVDEGYEIITF